MPEFGVQYTAGENVDRGASCEGHICDNKPRVVYGKMAMDRGWQHTDLVVEKHD